jgi:hypothetical protein
MEFYLGLVFSALTAAGPLIALAGLAMEIQTVFWIGIAICAANLFMNLASGAMKLPILPGALIVGGMLFWKPWLVGAALGLLIWTTLEAIGELLSTIRRR